MPTIENPSTSTLVLLVLYALPSIVASARKPQNTAGIVIVNLLLGWTFVGWVVALVWALSGKKQESVPPTPAPAIAKPEGPPQDTP